MAKTAITAEQVVAAVTRDKKVPCQDCGEVTVWHINMGSCDVCFVIAYLKFRHAWGWPLDDLDKKRLGLVTTSGG